MHRRDVLATVAGASAAGLAGCSSILGGDGDDDGPRSPVEALATAYAENDADAARDAIHPDGPAAGSIGEGTVEATEWELAEPTVTDEPSGEPPTVTVEADVTIASGTSEWTERRRFAVRESDDGWRVWAIATGPELAVEGYVRAIDEDRPAAAREHLHPDSPDRAWATPSVIVATSLSLVSVEQESTGPREAAVAADLEEVVGGEPRRRSESVTLARVDGEWRVSSLGFGPVESIRTFVRAIEENDPAAIESVSHPENTAAVPDEQDLALFSTAAIEDVESATVGEGEATVTAVITLAAFGREQRTRVEFVLRPHDGRWAVLDSQTPG